MTPKPWKCPPPKSRDPRVLRAKTDFGEAGQNARDFWSGLVAPTVRFIVRLLSSGPGQTRRRLDPRFTKRQQRRAKQKLKRDRKRAHLPHAAYVAREMARIEAQAKRAGDAAPEHAP